MKKLLCTSLLIPILAWGGNHLTVTNTTELQDGNRITTYVGTEGINKLRFDTQSKRPILCYQIYSSGDNVKYDPSNWTLKGSNDGRRWITVDKRSRQKFSSRYQEILNVVQNPGVYEQYILEVATANNDTLKISEVILFDKNRLAGWENFKYPTVKFESLDPDTDGSEIYNRLVQDPDAYIKYHCRKVAEILYFTANDEMTNVQEIHYTLKNYDGVSAKGGNAPNINIVYSTQHIEKSAKESLLKLDFETRGVLYHELTHGYQFEPKGVGNYGNNKIFWSCIEGIADAVRAEAGLFDMSTRKPGGNWMDGYRTTGFFIQWLTTKDKDAIRKFHRTVKDLEVWSWDDAIKSVFGQNSSIESLWDEYQNFLKSENK